MVIGQGVDHKGKKSPDCPEEGFLAKTEEKFGVVSLQKKSIHRFQRFSISF